MSGKAFDRRRWRIKGERLGAAVANWQGFRPPQTEAGTARGVAKQLRPPRKTIALKSRYGGIGLSLRQNCVLPPPSQMEALE